MNWWRRSWPPRMRSNIEPALTQNSFAGWDKRAAFALEEQLAQRAFQLVHAVLRISMPPDTDVYDAKHLNRHIPAVLELARRIADQGPTPQEKNNG